MRLNEQKLKCPVCNLTLKSTNVKLHIGRMANLEAQKLYTHTKHFTYRQNNLSEYNKRTKTLWKENNT